MIFFGESDIGKVRENNEDTYLIKEVRENVILFVVADGVGGHNKGEFASRATVFEIAGYIERHIRDFWAENEVDGFRSLRSMLSKAIERANEYVFHYASIHDEYFGMGTTGVLGLLVGERLLVANVGDSRLYLKRDDILKQITVDHSYTQELVSSGIITKEEARTHDKKNIVLRAIGTEESILIDIYDVELKYGDSLLFCTDGLTDMVEDEKISKIMGDGKNPSDIARKLILEANNAGGVDNITVVVANYFD
ncbi:MAG: Stp1/IreP family PP2C-type Ser/Thr phosphatase [Filifactoraceae bacterium]